MPKLAVTVVPKNQRSPALEHYYSDLEKHRAENRAATQRWRERNPGKSAEQQRIFREKNPTKQFEYGIKCRYGVSLEEYEEIFDRQLGVCALCEQPFKRWPCIDHDHTCKEHSSKKGCKKCIRGLLCIICNGMIARIEKNPSMLERVKAYLAAKGSD